MLKKDQIAQIVSEVIDREGGFVEHENDRGKATNWGITISTLSRWRGKEATVEDVRNLPRHEAARIITQRYVLEPGLYNFVDQRLGCKMIDMSVHHGPRRAVKILQRAVEVKEDGLLGPVTLGAAHRLHSSEVLVRVVQHRSRRFAKIVADDPSQSVFIVGWITRSEAFLPYVS